jgi:hypothetical protein
MSYAGPDQILTAIAQRPGSRAGDLGAPMQVAARLRRLREAGQVVAHGPSPARWYPTAAGLELANRHMLRLLRARGREARKQRLAAMRCAEDLAAFAETLTKPSPPRLVRCCCRYRALTFRELASTLQGSVGRDVLISTDIGRIWPQLSPITAVGTIDRVEEERGLAVEDWLITATVGETAFVEFSRRHFESAVEDVVLGELHVQQGQTTVIWFEPTIL